jgi:hypothetical protein
VQANRKHTTSSPAKGCCTRLRGKIYDSEAAIATGTTEPPVWLKPVACPTEMGFSGFAQYRLVQLLILGRSDPKKQQINPLALCKSIKS